VLFPRSDERAMKRLVRRHVENAVIVLVIPMG
jgi:hypothetical protein